MVASSTKFLDLPDEILLKIATFLSISDWICWTVTCHRLGNIISGSVKTLRINVLWKEDLDFSTEILRKYWNQESRMLHLRSMQLTKTVWKKVKEKQLQLCPQPKHWILTDCNPHNGSMLLGMAPETLKLIRCRPSHLIYHTLASWSPKAFIDNGSKNIISLFVDGGTKNTDLTPIFLRSLDMAVHSNYKFEFQDHERPIKLIVKDVECNTIKTMVVSRWERRKKWYDYMENRRTHFTSLVRRAIGRRGDGRVALGVTFSRGGQEDIFKVVVSTSSIVTARAGLLNSLDNLTI